MESVAYDCQELMMKDSPTREAGSALAHLDRDGILSELDRILASPHFRNSKRYPALLRHIVEGVLDGRANTLKERTLGVEIFGRSPDYDTNSDTIVRYTAAEVRKRLLLYYSEEEHKSEIRISLSPGSYVPEFQQAAHLPSAEPANPASGTSVLTLADKPAEKSSSHPAPAASPLDEIRTADEPHRNWGKTTAWAALLLTLGFAVFTAWKWHREPAEPASSQSALSEFWAPMVAGQASVLVCTGGVVFSQGNYSGTTTANRDVEYPFVSMQSAGAIARVSGLVERSGATTQLIPSSTTTLNQLQERPATFLGGYNNQWTMRLLQPVRYHFAPEPLHSIVDSTRSDFQLARDHSVPYSSADDYAVVARFRDPVTDSWSMVLAGIGRNGTEAAADFATSAHYIQLLRDQISGGFGNRNIEAVLKVKVIDGRTGAPSIVAAHVW